MPHMLRRALCLCSLLLAGPLAAQTSFNTVVVFGDSLSDTGNIAHLTQAASGGLIRYPADNKALGLDYTDGRFTDGKDTQPAASAYLGVWIEQLAASFAAKPAVTDSLDGGTNYAYGDATTANSTTTVTEGPLSITLHNMGQQVNDYLGQSPAPVPNAKTLYVFWGGANDIYQAVSAAVTAGTDPTAAATAAATTAVSNESNYIQELIGRGATSFLVLNEPPLGAAPMYTVNSTALNTGAAVLAQALPPALAAIRSASGAKGVTVNFYAPDVFSQFQTLPANAMSLGLSDVFASADKVPVSPDTFLLWDGLHPTTTGHHLVAALAANLFTPLLTSSTALTTPTTLITGQIATLSAKVTSSGSSAVPTGLVSFFHGTGASGGLVANPLLGSATLDATGTATTTFLAGAGPYSITAVYAGDTTYTAASSAAATVPVLPAPVSTTTTLISSNPDAATGTTVIFTATITPATSMYGSPTGVVVFRDGLTPLAIGTLTNGVATATVSTLAAGAHSITASYAGIGVFGASNSAALAETVGTPAFTVTPSSGSLAITAGSTGQTSFTIQAMFGPLLGFGQTCGTLPAHMVCSFVTPAVVSSTGASSVTLSILTSSAAAALQVPDRPGTAGRSPTYFGFLLFPALGGLFWHRGRRRRMGIAASLTCLVVITAGMAGCSGGSNNTARGTYTVPVIFTATGATTQTVNLAVTVQ